MEKLFRVSNLQLLCSIKQSSSFYSSRALSLYLNSIPRSSLFSINSSKTVYKPLLIIQSRPKTSFSDIKFDKSSRISDYFRGKDGIPPSYTLIYRAEFPNYFLTIQILNMLIQIAVILILALKGLQYLSIREEAIEDETSENKEKEELVKLNPPQFDTGGNESMPNPSFDEMTQGDLETMGVLFLFTLLLGISFMKLQRSLPLRIYVNKNDHCFAVFYGHLVPTKTTRYEFVAGTLRSLSGSKHGFNQSTYEDASGHRMMIFDGGMRRPADLNRLLGLTPKSSSLEEEDEELEQKNKN